MVRELEIRTWLKMLRQSFGDPYPVVDPKVFQHSFREKRFTDVVVGVRDALKLSDIGFRIGYVRSGGDMGRVAWISVPGIMPMYGSPAFKALKLEMFIRREFLELNDLAVALMIISHELSHVVLDSLHHQLRLTEPAVDLTAMYLGFRQAFITPNAYENPGFDNQADTLAAKLERLLSLQFADGSTSLFTRQLVYLSVEERKFAARLMGTTEPFRK